MAPLPILSLTLLLVAAIGWAAPAAAGQIDPETWHVKHPGIVLVDPAARAAELQRVDATERRRLCPPPAIEADPIPVISLVGPATASGSDPAAQPFTLAVIAGAAAGLAGDRAAAAGAIALLARWARADALSNLVEAGPERTNANTLYSLKRALLGVLPAWALLAEPASPAQRLDVVDRLTPRVADADAPTGPAAAPATEN